MKQSTSLHNISDLVQWVKEKESEKDLEEEELEYSGQYSGSSHSYSWAGQ